jgi:hypothetical protein
MGYVPRLTNDVFVSYSHIDNQTAADDEGWVTRFAAHLRIRLSQLLGAGVEVWRDARLGPGDVFSAKIDNAVKDSAVFIPIVSPGYLESDWCHRELEAFTQAAAKTGGVMLDDVSRIMKVVKTPLDDNAERTISSLELGCEFYEVNADSGRFQEFDPASPEFGARLEQLVQKLRPLLKAMRKSSTVYVGGQQGVCDNERKKLRQELEARRFIVVPKEPLPPEVDVATAAVRQAMGEASVSVHLIEGPGGDQPSMISTRELQVATDLGLLRIVSLTEATPPRTEPNGPGTANTVPSLSFDLGAVDGRTEVLENKTIEALKEAVIGELRNAEMSRRFEQVSPPPPGHTPGADLVRVYLVCDRADHPVFNDNNARRIQEYLFQLGFEVKLPVSDRVDPAVIRRDNREKMKECDGVLLYWESTSDAWVDERLREVAKALGWRKARRFSGRGVYVTTPKEPWKERFESREPDVVIKQWTQFSPAGLEPFIKLLRRPTAPSPS